jgi:FtsP/CotA-like multicopper oxidase with cupredoxin domain
MHKKTRISVLRSSIRWAGGVFVVICAITGLLPSKTGLSTRVASAQAGTAGATPNQAPGTSTPANTKATKKTASAKRSQAGPLSTTQLKHLRLAGLPTSEWYDPQPIESSGGELRGALEVSMASNTAKVLIGGQLVDQKVTLRSYNGGLVGPTLIVKPGDTMFLSLRNKLDVGDDPPHCNSDEHSYDMNDPKNFCLNTTNLHTHGLHISPTGKKGEWSDNVMLSIKPGGSEDYKLQILPAGDPEPENPASHYPGTFWYHAHQHGSTSTQLASGMAGALIVKGDIDEYAGIKGARDRTFIFQQLAFDADGEIKKRPDNPDITSVMSANWRGGDPKVTGPPKNTTINGRLLPLITLRPGQVERWRFIDSGLFEMLDMWLENPESGRVINFRQIALDGITLRRVKEVRDVKMGPGYRTDVMVKAPDDAAPKTRFYLYKAPTVFTDDGKRAPGQVVAVVEIGDQPCAGDTGCHSAIPAVGAVLPAPRMLPDITRVDGRPKVVTFSRPGNKWLIDGQSYDHNTILPQFQLKKGRAEEWHIVNETTVGHPFHIHVNAFQLLDANGRPGEWRDTIIVPPKGTVKFRTRYERFTGKFVLHCHILFHEDTGMMQNVEIK